MSTSATKEVQHLLITRRKRRCDLSQWHKIVEDTKLLVNDLCHFSEISPASKSAKQCIGDFSSSDAFSKSIGKETAVVFIAVSGEDYFEFQSKIAACHRKPCERMILVAHYSESVTHVVCHTNSKHELIGKCSLDVTYGMAGKKLLVSELWLLDCIRQGKLLNEGAYKVQSISGTIDTSGFQRCLSSPSILFKGKIVILLEPLMEAINLVAFCRAIELQSGTAVRLQLTSNFWNVEADYYIASASGFNLFFPLKNRATMKKYKRTVVNLNWIVDCIHNFTLLPIGNYVLL